MTTRTRVIVARDLFVSNDVLRLSRGRYPRIPNLGGIAWIRREPAIHAHGMAMSTAVGTLKRALPNYGLWLLCAHTAVQPDSTVARHRRLWKSLEARGVGIPRGLRTREMATGDSRGTKWRGAVAIDAGDIAQAMGVVHAEAASLIVSAPETLAGQIDDLVARGWTSPSPGPPPEVLEWISSNDAIALWPVGGFDDVESGVVAVSSMGIVELLEASTTSC